MNWPPPFKPVQHVRHKIILPKRQKVFKNLSDMKYSYQEDKRCWTCFSFPFCSAPEQPLDPPNFRAEEISASIPSI